jgi:hypothetical protein
MPATSDTALPKCDALPSFLSVRQVAFLLDGTPDQIHRLVKQKVLRGLRLAGQTFIRTEEVRALLEARRCMLRAA